MPNLNIGITYFALAIFGDIAGIITPDKNP